MKEVTIEDDGMLPVTLNGVRIEIDLYDVYNRLSAADARVREELAGEPLAARQREYDLRVLALLAELGFGPVSHKAAQAFDAAVYAAVAELKKAPPGGPTPG